MAIRVLFDFYTCVLFFKYSLSSSNNPKWLHKPEKTPPNPPNKTHQTPNKDTQRTPSIFHPLFENSIFYLYINIKSRSLCSKILKNKIKHFTVYPVWFLSWNNLKKSLAPMFIHIVIRITFASSFLSNLTWFRVIFTQN